MQRRLAETPVETSEPRRHLSMVHASLMVLVVTLASAALLLLLLARPALS